MPQDTKEATIQLINQTSDALDRITEELKSTKDLVVKTDKIFSRLEKLIYARRGFQ